MKADEAEAKGCPDKQAANCAEILKPGKGLVCPARSEASKRKKNNRQYRLCSLIKRTVLQGYKLTQICQDSKKPHNDNCDIRDALFVGASEKLWQVPICCHGYHGA